MVVRGLACQLNIKPIVLDTGNKSNLMTLDEFKELQAAGPRADKQEIESALNHWRKKVEQSAKGRISSSLTNPNDFIPTCLAIISEMEKIEYQVASNGAGQPQSILEYLFGAPAEFLLTSEPGQTNPEAQWTWLLQLARSIFPSECALWGILVACKFDMVRLNERIFNAERNECGRLLGLDRLYADLVHYCRDNTQYVRENKDGGEGKCWDIHKALNEESAFAYSDQPWGDKQFKDESMLRGKESDDDVTKEAKQRLNKHVDDVISKGVQDVSQDGLDGIKYKVIDDNRLSRLENPGGRKKQKISRKYESKEYSHTDVLNEMRSYFKSHEFNDREVFNSYQPEIGHFIIAMTKHLLELRDAERKDETLVKALKISQYNKNGWNVGVWDKGNRNIGGLNIFFNDEGTASFGAFVDMAYDSTFSMEYIKTLSEGAINMSCTTHLSREVWKEALSYLIASGLGLAPKARIIRLNDLPYWPFIAMENINQAEQTFVTMDTILGSEEADKQEKNKKTSEFVNKLNYFIYSHLSKSVQSRLQKSSHAENIKSLVCKPQDYEENDLLYLLKLSLLLRLVKISDIHTSNYDAVYKGKRLWDFWIHDMNARIGFQGESVDLTMNPGQSGMVGQNNDDDDLAFGMKEVCDSADNEANPIRLVGFPRTFLYGLSNEMQLSDEEENEYFRNVGAKIWKTFVNRWRKTDNKDSATKRNEGSEVLTYISNPTNTVKLFAQIVQSALDQIKQVKNAADKDQYSPLKEISALSQDNKAKNPDNLDEWIGGKTTLWNNFLNHTAVVVYRFMQMEQICAPRQGA